MSDSRLRYFEDFVDVDQRILDIADAFIDQRLFEDAKQGNKQLIRSIALFGAPGTSKSATLTIAARLFRFLEHRTCMLNEQKQSLEEHIEVCNRTNLKHRINYCNLHDRKRRKRRWGLRKSWVKKFKPFKGSFKMLKTCSTSMRKRVRSAFVS